MDFLSRKMTFIPILLDQLGSKGTGYVSFKNMTSFKLFSFYSLNLPRLGDLLKGSS